MDDAAKPNDTPATPPAATPVESTAKRAYSKPTLTDHGAVADLTRGGTGTSSDGRAFKKLIKP